MTTRRYFPPLHRDIGAVGFGTWPLGGPMIVGGQPLGRGGATEDEAVDALQTAVARGIDFFDTADIYGAGRAESLIGISGLNDRVRATICTKFGNRIVDGSLVQDFSPEWLGRSVVGSQERMQVDKIDVLLLHSPPDDFDWYAYDQQPFEALVRTGKIGCYGVSCRSAEGAVGAISGGFGSVVEVIYNAVDRRIEEEVLPLAKSHDYAVIARMPLCYGLLVAPDKVEFQPGDHRLSLNRDERAWLSSVAQNLSFLNELPGGTVTSAIRFCLTDSRVSVVIPGMYEPAHIEAAAKAMALGPLPLEAIRKIEGAVPEIYDGWRKSGH